MLRVVCSLYIFKNEMLKLLKIQAIGDSPLTLLFFSYHFYICLWLMISNSAEVKLTNFNIIANMLLRCIQIIYKIDGVA